MEGAVAAETNRQDRRLMKTIARGDEAALARLYDRYGRYVYGLALRMIGDQETAEEITQDVFTRLWRRAPEYAPTKAAVSTWIMRIARNRAIDELRRRGARADSASVSWDEVAIGLSSDHPDPIDAVDLELKRRSIRNALAKLPEKQRQALALAFYRGYSHSEIADLLNEPLGTVKTRVRDGMKKLRSLIGVEGGAEAP
jgi:RNA polymerase sigma-70 factor (ECF subfamily)